MSTVGLTQTGATILGGTGVLAAGTVMGRITASKKWKAYLDGNSDGSEVARGVLRDGVDATSTTQEYVCNIVTSGQLRNSLIVGSNAAALVDLNARVDTVLDLYVF